MGEKLLGKSLRLGEFGPLPSENFVVREYGVGGCRLRGVIFQQLLRYSPGGGGDLESAPQQSRKRYMLSKIKRKKYK